MIQPDTPTLDGALLWPACLAAGACVALFGWLLADAVRIGLSTWRMHFQTRADIATRELFVAVSPVQLFRLNLFAIIVVGIATGMVTNSPLLVVVAVAAIAFAPRLMVAYLRRRRLNRIDEQLPALLQAVAGNMKVGISLSASLDHVARGFPPPMSQELQRVMSEQQMGISLDEALANLARRVPLPSVALATSAVRIAAQVGGPLSEMLERQAGSLRTRRAIEGKIRALTSQGKLQAVVMGALPPLLIAALCVIEPADMGRLFTTLPGWLTLATIIVLEVAGVWLIRRITTIDV